MKEEDLNKIIEGRDRKRRAQDQQLSIEDIEENRRAIEKFEADLKDVVKNNPPISTTADLIKNVTDLCVVEKLSSMASKNIASFANVDCDKCKIFDNFTERLRGTIERAEIYYSEILRILKSKVK